LPLAALGLDTTPPLAGRPVFFQVSKAVLRASSADLATTVSPVSL